MKPNRWAMLLLYTPVIYFFSVAGRDEVGRRRRL